MRVRILALAAALACGPALADEGTKQEQAACRPDVRRFCGHIGKSDSQSYRACLQTHISELSQKCQQVLMNHPN